MIKTLFLLSFAFSMVSCNNYRYVFAQEWPGSVCRHNNCQDKYIRNFQGSAFSIHGLWPDIDATSYCKTTTFCTHETFNPSSLSHSTQALLDSSWVGFYNDIDDFRSHEWTKHGTCWQGRSLVDSNQVQENFFLTVHSLWKNYDLFRGLAQAGVHPSNSQLYSYS